MIERKIVAERMREVQVHEFLQGALRNVGHSSTKIIRTPLGEKILIAASRPGLVVGRKGENIKKLTLTLKKKFKFENPEIEIVEVEAPNLDAQIVAERIASSLERFGTQRFKAIGHRTLTDVMGAGARGIEIHISGKVPSSRAKTWRFYSGYLKKSGDAAVTIVKKAYATAKLKSGTIGVKVTIMPPNIPLPDAVRVKDGVLPQVQESIPVSEEAAIVETPQKLEAKPKKRRSSSRKKPVKKESSENEQESKESPKEESSSKAPKESSASSTSDTVAEPASGEGSS